LDAFNEEQDEVIQLRWHNLRTRNLAFSTLTHDDDSDDEEEVGDTQLPEEEKTAPLGSLFGGHAF